jgi:transcriptional regulator with XRE-family HTH domain
MLINKRLRSLRIKHNLSVKFISKFLGIAESTYCGYEANLTSKHYREPSLEKIIKLANFYNVSVDYLTGYSEQIANYDKEYVINKVKEKIVDNEPLKALTIDTINKCLLVV